MNVNCTICPRIRIMCSTPSHQPRIKWTSNIITEKIPRVSHDTKGSLDDVMCTRPVELGHVPGLSLNNHTAHGVNLGREETRREWTRGHGWKKRLFLSSWRYFGRGVHSQLFALRFGSSKRKTLVGATTKCRVVFVLRPLVKGTITW